MFKIKEFLQLYKDSKKNIYNEKHHFNIYPELIVISCYLFFILIALFTTQIQIFGNKSNSLFDFWSFIHIFSGATLSYLAFRFRSFNVANPILLILVITLNWEILEMYIESGAILQSISHWFGGVEHFLNRFLADPLCIIIGFLLIKLRPQLYYIFFILTWIFVIFHIYIGSSTYLI